MRIDNEGVATGCKKTCCNIKCCKGVSTSEPEEIDVRLLQQYIATGCKKISIATLMDVLGNVRCSDKLTTNKRGHCAAVATWLQHISKTPCYLRVLEQLGKKSKQLQGSPKYCTSSMTFYLGHSCTSKIFLFKLGLLTFYLLFVLF